MPNRRDEYSEWTLEQVPADFLRKQNADRKIIQQQRTRDGRPPRIITLKTATDTTGASWVRFDGVIEPCVVQLLLSGTPTPHPIYMTTEPPDDTTQPLGRFLSNAAGTAYCLQVGPVWFYIPNQTGDAASFSAVVIYAGSELPAQLAALQAAAPAAAAAAPPNRSGGKTDLLIVPTPGTPVQYGTSRVVPPGMALSVIANPKNTQYVYVAFSSADANKSTGIAVVLAPGGTVRYYVNNWNVIWCDADVANEGIRLTAEI